MLHVFFPFNCSRFGLVASLLPGPPSFWGKLDLTMSGGLGVLEGKEFGLRSTRRREDRGGGKQRAQLYTSSRPLTFCSCDLIWSLATLGGGLCHLSFADEAFEANCGLG